MVWIGVRMTRYYGWNGETKEWEEVSILILCEHSEIFNYWKAINGDESESIEIFFNNVYHGYCYIKNDKRSGVYWNGNQLL